MINRDNPSLEYIKSKANEIPKFKKTIGIIEKELENKNTILAIGNAGALPDETYIIIRFSHKASEQYDELKILEQNISALHFAIIMEQHRFGFQNNKYTDFNFRDV